MKKLIAVIALIGLAGCASSYERTVAVPSGQRICYEYNNSFRCITPTRTWNEEVYPKNLSQKQYYWGVYNTQTSLSSAVYGKPIMYGTSY